MVTMGGPSVSNNCGTVESFMFTHFVFILACTYLFTDQLNTCVHATTQATPYQLVFGQPPRATPFPGATSGAIMEENVPELLESEDSQPPNPSMDEEHPHNPPMDEEHPHNPPMDEEHPHNPPMDEEHPHNPPMDEEHPHNPPMDEEQLPENEEDDFEGMNDFKIQI